VCEKNLTGAPLQGKHKDRAGLERLASEKHSSLLRTIINYSRKMFFVTYNRLNKLKCNIQLGCLESLANDKHSNLLVKFVSNEEKEVL
jgi:hypothetical protein